MKRLSELALGQRVEMEHTDDPRLARKIALDHLSEDPRYYSKMRACGLLHGARANPARENISADLPLGPRDEEWYRTFHGTEPSRLEERLTWVPGEMVLIGDAIDVGYQIKDKDSIKEHTQKYVHEHSDGVKVYRRARAGERPTRVWRNFPTNLRVLGYNIGFTYRDKNGTPHEVRGSSRKTLAVTPSGRTLVIVGPRGVEYVIEGGSMAVTNWIHD